MGDRKIGRKRSRGKLVDGVDSHGWRGQRHILEEHEFPSLKSGERLKELEKDIVMIIVFG